MTTLFLLLANGFSFAAASPDVINDAATVKNLVTNAHSLGLLFEFDAKVTFAPILPRTVFAVCDATGPVLLWNTCTNDIQQISDGDLVHIQGMIDYGNTKKPSADYLHANCLSMTMVSRGQPDKPIPLNLEQLYENTHNLRRISLAGTIVDVVRDEIDPRYAFFALTDGRETAYVPFKHAFDTVSNLEVRIGSKVSVTGLKVLHDPSDKGARRLGNHIITRPNLISDLPTSVRDAFDAPDIAHLEKLQPSQLASAGRHKARGHVLAVWGKDNVLIRTKSDELIKARLSSTELPQVGMEVEIAGLPETDLYHLSLSHAVWRASSGSCVRPAPPQAVSAKDILRDDLGRTRINPLFHGQRITLDGLVRSVKNGVTTELLIESEGLLIPVEMRFPVSNAAITEGCHIRATGVCILAVDNWRQNTIFPQIKGFLLVVQSPADIEIVERPPWWTPAKLVIVIVVMLAFLVAILIWNASLRILSERKSHALFKAQESKIESELRVDERTRLATELHDYLAQNLTAISYQVSAAQSAYAENNSCTGGLLKTIDRMLQSCRVELRRCLWDLRSDTLNEKDFTLALRNTILPVSGNAALNIRFPVRRSRLSDTTAQAILSIVRELVSNSVRHGKASVIRIAGSHDDTALRFSVFDNGSGFDPLNRLGQGDGHFGLDGVSDRIKRLDGTFTIESDPDNGTKITVSIPAHPAIKTT